MVIDMKLIVSLIAAVALTSNCRQNNNAPDTSHSKVLAGFPVGENLLWSVVDSRAKFEESFRVLNSVLLKIPTESTEEEEKETILDNLRNPIARAEDGFYNSLNNLHADLDLVWLTRDHNVDYAYDIEEYR